MAQLEEITQILSFYSKGDISSLIQVLQDIQETNGYLSEESILEVSNYYKIPSSRVYGIATYYNQFRFKPKAKFHFEICNGTGCYLENSELIGQYIETKISEYAKGRDLSKLVSIEKVPCMGTCAFSPVLLLNDELHIHLTKHKIDEIFENLDLKVQDE